MPIIQVGKEKRETGKEKGYECIYDIEFIKEMQKFQNSQRNILLAGDLHSGKSSLLS